MARALDVAKYFLNLSHPHTKESITNLKLQKLLYYAQGFHLGIYNKPLFPEEIQAWPHGPVVPQIYTEYKNNKANDITKKYPENEIKINHIERRLINDVWNIFKSYNGKDLERLTHSEDPWNIARGNLPSYAASNNEITTDSIRDYFEREYII